MTRAVVVLALIGLTLRALMTFSAMGDFGRHGEPDSVDYLALGRSLAEEGTLSLGGVPSYVRVPGFPAVIAACQLAFGDRAVPALLLLQAALVLVVLWLVVWTLRGVPSAPPSSAVVAAAVLALDPVAVGNSAMVLADSWLLLFSAASLAFCGASLRRDNLGWAVLAGAASGVGALFHAAATYAWAAGAVAHLADRRRSGPRRLVLAGALIASHVAILLPWALRNQAHFGHLTLTANSRKSVTLKAAIIESYALGVPAGGLRGLISGSPSDAEVLGAYVERHPESSARGVGALIETGRTYPGSTLIVGAASQVALLLDPGHVAVLKILGLPLGTGLLSGRVPQWTPSLAVMALTILWLVALWAAVLRGVGSLWRLDPGLCSLALATAAYYAAVFSFGALTTGCRYRLALLPCLAVMAGFAAAQRPAAD